MFLPTEYALTQSLAFVLLFCSVGSMHLLRVLASTDPHHACYMCVKLKMTWLCQFVWTLNDTTAVVISPRDVSIALALWCHDCWRAILLLPKFLVFQDCDCVNTCTSSMPSCCMSGGVVSFVLDGQDPCYASNFYMSAIKGTRLFLVVLENLHDMSKNPFNINCHLTRTYVLQCSIRLLKF